MLIGPAAHISQKLELFALSTLKCFALTLEHGIGADAPKVIAMYAAVVRELTQDSQLAYDFSTLAMDLDRTLYGRVSSPVSFLHAWFVNHWINPMRTNPAFAWEGARIGLNENDTALWLLQRRRARHLPERQRRPAATGRAGSQSPAGAHRRTGARGGVPLPARAADGAGAAGPDGPSAQSVRRELSTKTRDRRLDLRDVELQPDRLLLRREDAAALLLRRVRRRVRLRRAGVAASCPRFKGRSPNGSSSSTARSPAPHAPRELAPPRARTPARHGRGAARRSSRPGRASVRRTSRTSAT